MPVGLLEPGEGLIVMVRENRPFCVDAPDPLVDFILSEDLSELSDDFVDPLQVSAQCQLVLVSARRCVVRVLGVAWDGADGVLVS